MSSSTTFDKEEYLHLAIEATRRGDHGSALTYLKEGAHAFPQDARIAYLLGAEYAQIALYDRAEAELSRAVELDAGLHTACFQLGLLQMTQQKIDAATATWRGLDALPAEHALRLFRDGIVALAADRFAEARSFIQAGLAANHFSDDLNRDMEKLLCKIPEEGAVAPSEAQGNGHIWLNAYQEGQQPE